MPSPERDLLYDIPRRFGELEGVLESGMLEASVLLFASVLYKPRHSVECGNSFLLFFKERAFICSDFSSTRCEGRLYFVSRSVTWFATRSACWAGKLYTLMQIFH